MHSLEKTMFNTLLEFFVINVLFHNKIYRKQNYEICWGSVSKCFRNNAL